MCLCSWDIMALGSSQSRHGCVHCGSIRSLHLCVCVYIYFLIYLTTDVNAIGTTGLAPALCIFVTPFSNSEGASSHYLWYIYLLHNLLCNQTPDLASHLLASNPIGPHLAWPSSLLAPACVGHPLARYVLLSISFCSVGSSVCEWTHKGSFGERRLLEDVGQLHWPQR